MDSINAFITHIYVNIVNTNYRAKRTKCINSVSEAMKG